MNTIARDAWVLGGQSALGRAVGAALKAQGLAPLAVSRSAPAPGQLDLSDLDAVRAWTEARLASHGVPAAIVACQRYRPVGEADHGAAARLEVFSVQTMLVALCAEAAPARCQVVLVSSANGLSINPALPFWYHWLKASQLQLMRYFAVCRSGALDRINAVSPGSFIKGELAGYPAKLQEHFGRMRLHVPTGRVLDVDNVASSIALLLSPAATGINGQAIGLDGGVTHLFQETLI
jgi:NAD(P)-dependent dehydrogenase (short-subunit alcohol dehydrogenase family)